MMLNAMESSGASVTFVIRSSTLSMISFVYFVDGISPSEPTISITYAATGKLLSVQAEPTGEMHLGTTPTDPAHAELVLFVYPVLSIVVYIDCDRSLVVPV
jgi:hypothetical protein